MMGISLDFTEKNRVVAPLIMNAIATFERGQRTFNFRCAPQSRLPCGIEEFVIGMS